MDIEEIRSIVSSKLLIKSGLVFRTKDGSIKEGLNLEEHAEELSEILQDTAGISHLCDKCRSYGLEFFHLLQTPNPFRDEWRTSYQGLDEAEGWSNQIAPIEDLIDSCSMCMLIQSTRDDHFSVPGTDKALYWTGYEAPRSEIELRYCICVYY